MGLVGLVLLVRKGLQGELSPGGGSYFPFSQGGGDAAGGGEVAKFCLREERANVPCCHLSSLQLRGNIG